MSNNGKRKAIQADTDESSDPQSKKTRVLWNTDGVDGGKSSMNVLLDWLTDGNNYPKFKGGDPSCGLTKSALAATIVTAMEKEGIYHRKVY